VFVGYLSGVKILAIETVLYVSQLNLLKTVAGRLKDIQVSKKTK